MTVPRDLQEMPRVELREESPFPRIQQVMEQERAEQGRPRRLTQAVAASPAAWRATTNALYLYATLRTIDDQLVDVLCLYTSLLNGCRYCIDDAAGQALVNGWTPEELVAVAEEDFSRLPPARADALEYVRVVTLEPTNIDDAQLGRLRRHYDDEAILELTAVVAMKNFWNRFASALRIPPEGKCGDHELFHTLLELSEQLRSARRRTAFVVDSGREGGR